MGVFTLADYDVLRHLTHRISYPGFRYGAIGLDASNVRKNVAGIMVDHLEQWEKSEHFNRFEYELLVRSLIKGHDLACQVAADLELPPELYPSLRHSILRILDYPPGSGTLPHPDKSLFTMALYRNIPGVEVVKGYRDPELVNRFPGIQFGGMFERASLGEQTYHQIPEQTIPQHSIIYFARPDMTEFDKKYALLPKKRL
jgi:hypothetical protein